MISDLVSAARQCLAQVYAACERPFRRVAKIESGPGKGLRFEAGPGSRHFISGTYERPVQEALATLVKSGAVCFDIGANLGFFTVLLGRLAGPAGSIYAFEPVPANASTIERNVRLNRLSNTRVLRIALSRVDGVDDLLLARHIGGAVLKGAGVPPDLAGHITVRTRAIDTLVECRKIESPDVVKIDVEGAEMDVLLGMEKVLRAQAPIIVLELDDQTEAACEKKLSWCQSFLGDLGYGIKRLPNAYPDGRWFVRHLVADRK